MSKRSYLEAILEGLRAVSEVDVVLISDDMGVRSPMNSAIVNSASDGTMRKKIHVRLLLSIDRRETTEAAMDTVCYPDLVFKDFF